MVVNTYIIKKCVIFLYNYFMKFWSRIIEIIKENNKKSKKERR